MEDLNNLLPVIGLEFKFSSNKVLTFKRPLTGVIPVFREPLIILELSSIEHTFLDKEYNWYLNKWFYSLCFSIFCCLVSLLKANSFWTSLFGYF